jgi:Mn-dependent DtxR family transcriptional regulator
MEIHESGENYLETILILEKRNGYVRSIDIANELNFSKPSVSRAVKVLKENNYIIVKNDGHILLSEEGRKKAEGIYDRHVTLTNFLAQLGVNKTIAEEDACRIEHIISEETYQCIKKSVK